MERCKSATHWNDIPKAGRIALIVLGGTDLGLRAWSLVDLVRRPATEVQGHKGLWAVVLALVNSVGVLPTIYLTKARRR